jgi:hypothetical protein
MLCRSNRSYVLNMGRAVLGVLLVLGMTTTAFALQPDTWKLAHQFNKPIGCGYFFDKDHGLIGSGIRPATYSDQRGILHTIPGDTISIYKTTDGGVTWEESQVPIKLPGAVTSISMVDTLIGYASIFSTVDYDDYRTFGRSSIWKTTDGGDTWFDSLHLDHLATSVYAQNGLLLFTKWDIYYTNLYSTLDTYGGAYSYDGGQTWTKNFRRGDGVAFSDSLNGVVTEMNSDLTTQNFWSTMDAGRSWQQTSGQYESWSVYAVPGKRTYFCANESQGYIPHTTINWSSDGGRTWGQRAYFPYMEFTGTIDGKGNTLYFQTDTSFYPDGNSFFRGLYRSDDLGMNWHWISGPSNSRDTRFVVTGCSGEVVYAFDPFGGVWKTVDGGDGTMPGGNPADASFLLSDDTIHWTPNPCGDTLSLSAFSTSCVPVTIDSASIVRSTEFLHIRPDTSLPRILALNDSAHVSLLYAPTHSGQSTSLIRVYGHDGSRIITRNVTIILNDTLRSGIVLSKDSSVLAIDGCGAIADTIYLANLGCSGLILDSIVIADGEVSVFNQLPDSISDNNMYPLEMVFAPDSAGVHTFPAYVYAHTGRQRYDTVIAISAQSTRASLAFRLDSTLLAFSTNYCKPQSRVLPFGTTSCDSVEIDSIVFSNPSFSIGGGTTTLAPRSSDSLTISFLPDSIGLTRGTAHIYGHSSIWPFDTVVFLTAFNAALPQALTLSQSTLTLAASACNPSQDTLSISNQGCDLLYLDSIIAPDSEIMVSYDSILSPLRSNDSLPLYLSFTPSDGKAKSLPLRLVLHTANRSIDTIIQLNLSNAIPVSPIALSNDSLSLLTQYCQPTSTSFTITNFGCSIITVDSVIVENDIRHEFQIEKLVSSIDGQDSSSGIIDFIPDTSGKRTATIKVFTHVGGIEVDTTLMVTGRNITAPEPYIPGLTNHYAGETLRIPIMLRPTNDAFSLQSYTFHLSFNTDLLTPYALDFTNTCGKHVIDSSLEFEPGKGVSVRVQLADPITDSSDLTLPLVYILDSVAIAVDTITQVTLDTFVTDREPTLALCSFPSQPFQLLFACDYPIFQFMSNGTVTFDIMSINPNPIVQKSAWDLIYDIREQVANLMAELYDANGHEVCRKNNIPSNVGQHSITIPTPNANGDYFLVVRSASGQQVRKVTVK